MVRFKVCEATTIGMKYSLMTSVEPVDPRGISINSIRRISPQLWIADIKTNLFCFEAECDHQFRWYRLGCGGKLSEWCVLLPSVGPQGWSEMRSTLVKYYSPATNICIIRVARDPYRIAWGAVTLLSSIDGKKYIPNVVHVSGIVYAPSCVTLPTWNSRNHQTCSTRSHRT
jgi:Rpp14/Pop5 family